MAGVSVTNTYLSKAIKVFIHRVSGDSVFDSNWKELVEREVSMCGSLSK